MHVVITGAGRGIGKALRNRYSAGGHRVTGTARSGGEAVKLDVGRPEDFGALDKALSDDAVDLLICNAGVYPDKGQTIESGFSAATWAEALTINVTGVFLTVQTCLPALMRAEGARIAIISSRMGSQELAGGGSYAYRASKAAALNLGRNLAVDLAPRGIAVGIYHPGWVRTDMGGKGGDVSIDESADGLVLEFGRLNLATSGCFRSYDGRDLPF